MANRYWVNNGGDWSQTSHWSTTSGGAGGASVPNDADDVFFDTNSFSSNAQTVTVTGSGGVGAFCRNITTTTGTNRNFTILVSYSWYLVFTGSMSLNPRCTIAQTGSLSSPYTGSGYVAPLVNGAGRTIDQNGATLAINFYFQSFGNPTDGWVLTDNFELEYGYRMDILEGDFDAGDWDLVAAVIQFSGGTSNWDNASTIEAAVFEIKDTHIATIHPDADIIISTDWGAFVPTLRNTVTGTTFGNVSAHGHTLMRLYGSGTIDHLSLSTSMGLHVQAGTTWTIGDLDIGGAPGATSGLVSLTVGSPFTLNRPSGYFISDYLYIQDSTVTGGSGWFAGEHSVDAGNNTGWVFDDITYTYTINAGASGGGVGTIFFISGTYDITSTVNGGGRATYLTQYQPLPQKDYEYRVFDHDGNFIAIWQNVSNEFAYDQTINQTAGEVTVDIARSPENRTVVFDPLKDSDGNNILDDASQPIYAQTETANAIGPGTDVEENYNVDIYAFYGGYEALLDEFSDIITDSNNDPILVQYGAPNGKRVYSGYIAKARLRFGSNMGVSVTLVPHATEMNHFVFKDGTDTTVEYNTDDPVQMARDAIDLYNTEGGVVTYTNASMPLSGEVSSYDFKLQTTKEVMDKVIELLPVGYYHYPHPGENIQYLLPKSEEPDHIFYYEMHLSDIEVEKSITQLINEVYFVGGVPDGSPDGTPNLFKHYEDATSQANIRRGLERLSDSRVTLDTSAQALSQSKINQYKDPRYTTTITISDAAYDIESINLGEMVGFRNFGTFIDELVLQIVSIHRRKHEVTLDLDMIVQGEAKRLEEIKRNILSESVRNLDNAPT